MLRKVLWTVVLALSTMLARRAAMQAWRLITGEKPPVRR
jgi:hypothetical protein